MNKKKRVIFQVNDLGISGGAERVAVSWANYLAQKHDNIQVELLVFTKNKSFYNVDNRVKINVLDIDIDERNYKAPKNSFEKAQNILKETSLSRLFKIKTFFDTLNSEDVVIINKFEIVRPIFLLKNIGLIKAGNLLYFYHGCSETYLKSISSRNRKMVFNLFDKVIFLFKPDITGLNDIDESKINILPNPLPFKSDELCDLNSKNVLIVGRLSEEKGIDLLIKAWAQIRNNSWKLQIVGDGEKIEELKKLAEDLQVSNSICFEGQQSDIKKYYLNASIYAMTSKTEGMPMVLLEAMECGMPIICFEIPATRNLMRNTGILIEQFDIKKFAQELKELMDNYENRLELSRKSKQKASEFTSSKVAEILKGIIELK